jgi:hypothetical protein
MKITRCDLCPNEHTQQGMARPRGWGSVKLAERVHNTGKGGNVDRTENGDYELCHDCLDKVKRALTKEHS